MLRLSIAALLAMTVPAFAQPGQPLQNTFTSCGQFEKTSNGAWRARSWVALPCGIALSPRNPFRPGAIYCGRDLASELDDACSN
jgi:hypothetical protein